MDPMDRHFKPHLGNYGRRQRPCGQRQFSTKVPFLLMLTVAAAITFAPVVLSKTQRQWQVWSEYRDATRLQKAFDQQQAKSWKKYWSTVDERRAARDMRQAYWDAVNQAEERTRMSLLLQP